MGGKAKRDTVTARDQLQADPVVSTAAGTHHRVGSSWGWGQTPGQTGVVRVAPYGPRQYLVCVCGGGGAPTVNPCSHRDENSAPKGDFSRVPTAFTTPGNYPHLFPE